MNNITNKNNKDKILVDLSLISVKLCKEDCTAISDTINVSKSLYTLCLHGTQIDTECSILITYALKIVNLYYNVVDE